MKEESDEDFILREKNAEKVQKAYQQLGIKCQEVVKLFYDENLSVAELKDRLGYASKVIVKSQKLRGMKQIKEISLKLK